MLFMCVCVGVCVMAKPQLARIDELEEMARVWKKQKQAPDIIIKKLDKYMMSEFGYTRTTRNDYIKIIKVKLWGHT